MKAQRIMLSLAIMISLVLGNVSAVFALPPLPSSFYGVVTVDGANAPDGSTVSAWINGVKYAESIVGIYEGQTTYSLNVPGDDSSSGEIEGGAAGDTITFYVNDLEADQTAAWVSEANTPLNLAAATPVASTLTCESFDGLTPGSRIGSYNGWTDGGSSAAGPTVTAGVGVETSVGLGSAGSIYNWTAHPFNWNAADFQSIVLQHDFKTDASGRFDDDRLSWTIDGTSNSSNNQFGVQLDHPNGGIVTYWSNTIGSTKINDVIVPLTAGGSGTQANTWYRFTAEIFKLTTTSARIDVSLVMLDAAGEPTGTSLTGSVADTGALAAGHTPAAAYFTATTMVPSYKNYTTSAAPADNPCYEVKTGTPPAQYTLTTNVSGSGTIALDPTGGTYYDGTVVELTANPAVGYSFSGWSGDVTGTDNPASIIMTGNKAVTATFTQVPPVQLTVNTVGSGTVTLDPAGRSYPVGTVVELTVNPATGYIFSGWSGDLTGATNPVSVTMDVAKMITATFVEQPPQPAGTCESFNTGFTTGQAIGAHAEWYDAGSGGPVVTSGNGVSGSVGLAPGSSIFNWTEHPFSWNDPAFENIRLSMDFQTNASGQFDDDRMGWTIAGDNSSSAYEFGIQLDTVSGGDGGIVTYWRTDIDDTSTAARVQTPIVPLTALTANAWYRLSAMITKLTDTSAKIDVILTQLDVDGNPTGTPITGTLDDTSTWVDGTPDPRYFTATTMWPTYKNHNATVGAADNACFDAASARFAFIVTSDWHTIDGNGLLGTKVGKIDEIPEALAPSFMVITGDFPHLSQTESMIDAHFGASYLWYPVIGNHEIDDVINDFNVIRDTMVPSLPNIVNHGPTGSLNTSYSFDYENAHFLVVNPFWDGGSNDHTAGGDIPAALNSWVNSDLAANTETHKFVFIHTPPYPEHRHVAEDLDANPANRNAFISTLSANGVESIFSGHTHYYEHDTSLHYPLLGNMHQITNGSMRGADAPSTVTYVLVEGNTATYKVYSWNGSAFTLLEQWNTGGGVPSTPPVAPDALSATAASYARIGLTWNDNSDNEAGFEIERSTTGSTGTFSLLATVPAETESYTDNGLTAESEYCYRVRAVNAAGQSTYTNVDCATTPVQPPVVGICEDFDSGFTVGQVVGVHADWFDGSSGPIVTSGNGVAGSTGLAAATNIFTWNGQPFDWNDPAFQSVNFTMDFKSDGSGQFDDDRIGWTTSSTSTDSAYQFGVQLDTADGGITTYWRNGTVRVQDPIVGLTGVKANTWYRFNAEFTRLTATSARIEVSLVELDDIGNPTGAPITGTVADTGLLGSGKTPNASYFTATTLWPSYKTYNSGAAAPADNACYETINGLNTIINDKPANPSFSADASFVFTSTEAGSTFECKLDSGNFAACTSPQSYTGLLDGSHTFQVRASNGGEIDLTPASYTWVINTSLPNWNDDFNFATVLGDLPHTESQDSTTATVAADDPVMACGNRTGSHTLWYRYTPSTNGTLTVDTLGSAYDTIVGIWIGSRGSLTLEKCNDDYTGYGVNSYLQTDVLAGQTYYIEVAGYYDTSFGSMVLNLDGPASSIMCHPLTRSHTGQGTDPFASPTSSAGCTTGNYLSGQLITLTANPASGWYVHDWDGTSNDTSLSTTNTVTMPAGAHLVAVNYSMPPDTTITSQPDSLTRSSTASFSFTSNDATAIFECRLDSGSFSACTTPKNYNGLGDGSHTFEIRAKDGAGITDTSPASYTWIVDTTAPGTAIDSQPTNPSNSANASFAFSSADTVATFECRLDGGNFSACTSPKEYMSLNFGAHTFEVRARDAAGNVDATPASYTWTISIAPAIAMLVSPSGNSEFSNPTYTWNEVPGATWYYLWVSGPSGNLHKKWYTSAQANCNGTSCSLSNVTPNLTAGTHTWWIQTWNDLGYGPWSSRKTFIPVAPGKATLASPTGSLNQAATYTWNEVPGATWYYLWVDGPAGNVHKQWYTSAQANCNSTTCSLSNVTPGLTAGTYKWWIQTWNNAGSGPWSEPLTFSPAVPAAATLVSPNGNSGSKTPSYTWNEVPEATWYYLWINDASGTLVFKRWYKSADANCNGTCSVTPPVTLSSGDYKWWIQTWNDAGYGNWSTEMTFNPLPGQSTLTLPSGTATNNPTYTWNEVPGATWYYLWVSGPSGNLHKKWYTSAQANCNGTSCSLSNVTPNLTAGTHTWWIQTWNDLGYGPWSSGKTFIIP